MKYRILVLALFSIAISSCHSDDNTQQDTDYFIGANILGTTLRNAQTVFDGGISNQINVFDSVGKTMLIQSYKNGRDEIDGYWSIRFLGLDIENLTLPYTLTGIEGTVVWVDESVKPLKSDCNPMDVLCFYAGVGVDEVTITIDKVANNEILGTFSGVLYHVQVNPTVDRDATNFVELCEGQFKIKYLIH